ASWEHLLFDHAADGGPYRKIVLEGVLLNLIDGGLADSARGGVDDAQQIDGIAGAKYDFEISEDVFNFGALIEAEAADHHILAAVAAEAFFDLAGLEVGPVKDGDSLLRIG